MFVRHNSDEEEYNQNVKKKWKTKGVVQRPKVTSYKHAYYTKCTNAETVFG